MNASGTVIAFSEVLRLKLRNVVIFKIHNAKLDIVFHILSQDSTQFKWKDKVVINGDFIFTQLKLNVLNKGTLTELTLLMTTPHSICCELSEDNVKLICNDDLNRVAHQFTCKNSSILRKQLVKNTSFLITYDGFITEDGKAKLGLYELDNKVVLCTSFLMWSSDIPQLHKGDKVVVYNVHVMKGLKEQMTLVCCGLSSVFLIESNINDGTRKVLNHSCLLYFTRKLNLNFREFLWLNEVTNALLYKLSPKFLSEVELLSWSVNSSNHKENILSVLLKCKKLLGEMTSERMVCHSAFQEFTSEPHTCFNNLKARKLLVVQFTPIQDIISLAKTKALQVENSAMWKHCILDSHFMDTIMILVGAVDSTEDGNLIIKDQTGSLLCHFIGNDEKCSEEYTCISGCMCSNYIFPYKCIIGVKKFQVVMEHISKFDTNEIEIMYVQFTYSSIVVLQKWDEFDLRTQERGVSDKCRALRIHDTVMTKTDIHSENSSFMPQNSNTVKDDTQSSDTINIFSESFHPSLPSSVSSLKSCTKAKECSLNLSQEDNLENVEICLCQKFIVRSKSFPFCVKENRVSFQVSASLLGEAYVKVFKDEVNGNHFSMMDDVFREAVGGSTQTMLRDDSWFKHRVLKFHNSYAKNYPILSHNYLYLLVIQFNFEQSNSRMCDKGVDYRQDQYYWWKKWNLEDETKVIDVSTNMIIPLPSGKEIRIDEKELEIASANNIEKKSFVTYQVQEIVSKKCRIGDTCRVIGKVLDKKYCRQLASDSVAGSDDITLCLKLQDAICDDAVYVYFLTMLHPVLGLLPSAIVDLCGLKVCCSQKGNIYLKTVSPFELNILKSGGFSTLDDYAHRTSIYTLPDNPVVPWNLFSKVAQKSKMKSLSFMIRILRVELKSLYGCANNSEDNCSDIPTVKAEAKFLADDGSGQAIVFCKDETVKQLLCLEEHEWKLFKDFALLSNNNLIYECSDEPPLDRPVEVQVFYVVCRRSALRRQVVMECRAYLSQDCSSNPGFQRLSLYCITLSEPVLSSVSREFLAHLKKQIH